MHCLQLEQFKQKKGNHAEKGGAKKVGTTFVIMHATGAVLYSAMHHEIVVPSRTKQDVSRYFGLQGDNSNAKGAPWHPEISPNHGLHAYMHLCCLPTVHTPLAWFFSPGASSNPFQEAKLLDEQVRT